MSWWRADGNTLDLIGANNAVSSSASYQPGKLGQGFALDGAGTRIEFGDPASLRFTTEFSFELWAFVAGPTPVGGSQVLFFRGDSRPGMDPYGAAVNAPQTLVFNIDGINGKSASVSHEIPLRAWTHVACVFDHGKLQMYLNGERVAQTETDVYPFADLQPGGGFTLGNTTSSHNFPFGGVLDEIAAYSRPLTAEEVQHLFLLGGLKRCPETLDFATLRPDEIAAWVAEGCAPPIHQAKGEAQVVNGFVVGVKLTDYGYGYTNPPIVKLVGGGGAGATATGVVTNGMVVAIEIESTGRGYSGTPTVKIASPNRPPEVGIRVTRVAVDLKLVLGGLYQIYSSPDLNEWTAVGSEFVAEEESLTQEFETGKTGQYFRVMQLR